MRVIVYLCLFALLILMFLVGFDMEVARRDYVDAKATGDKIIGCLFDLVCDRYNKMLDLERK